MTDMPKSIFAQKAYPLARSFGARSYWYPTQIIPTLTEYVRKDIHDAVVDKGREAALCVITADGQAQDALDRALKAEGEVACLREAVTFAIEEWERCNFMEAAVNKLREARSESLAADDNHL